MYGSSHTGRCFGLTCFSQWLVSFRLLFSRIFFQPCLSCPLRGLSDSGKQKESCPDQVPTEFAKLIEVLLEVFGVCSRVMVHRVQRVLYEKCSLLVDFSFEEILLDRLIVLRDRIVPDHFSARGTPRRRPVPEPISLVRIGRFWICVESLRSHGFRALDACWTSMTFLGVETPIHIVASESFRASKYAISTANQRRGNRRAAR